MKDRHTRISKFLSLVLRHQPEQVGIALGREVTFTGVNRR